MHSGKDYILTNILGTVGTIIGFITAVKNNNLAILLYGIAIGIYLIWVYILILDWRVKKMPLKHSNLLIRSYKVKFKRLGIKIATEIDENKEDITKLESKEYYRDIKDVIKERRLRPYAEAGLIEALNELNTK